MSQIEQQLRTRLHAVRLSRDNERALHVKHFHDLSTANIQLHTVRGQFAKSLTVIATMLKGLDEGMPREDIARSARTSLYLPGSTPSCR